MPHAVVEVPPPTPECAPLRPDPGCYGCLGTGRIQWQNLPPYPCPCMDVCENHADPEAAPCREH